MFDSTHIADSIVDSVATVQKVATEVAESTPLSQVINDLLPLILFIGIVVIGAAIFFIWDSKNN